MPSAEFHYLMTWTILMKARSVLLCVFMVACATANPPNLNENDKVSSVAEPAKPDATILLNENASSQSAAKVAVEAASIAIRQYASFDEYKADFISRTIASGEDASVVHLLMNDAQLLERVIQSDSSQPEFSRPVSVYIKNAATPSRMIAARDRLMANQDMNHIEVSYGLPRALLGGIWVMESDMGRVLGEIDVVSALTSLGYEGRRRAWAEGQLLACLQILKTQKARRDQLKGSWAGAMGQTQFLPDNFLKLARDGDRDGRIDIWASESDALASAAHLLEVNGWVRGQSWAVEVTLPDGFDYYLAETTRKSPKEWEELGVRRSDNALFSAIDQSAQASLLLPVGAKGPAFLAFPNHFVIRRYNNSVSYALAVGLIADGINGRTSVKTPWPNEVPLSRAQRIGAQQALTSLGFSPGKADGVIGSGSRAALREWQRANGRPADGYLSSNLADELIILAAEKS
jgi:lytic murein transglycosylase